MFKFILMLTFIFISADLFSCELPLEGSYHDANHPESTLEIKLMDCTPTIKISFPNETREGLIIADGKERVIWDRGYWVVRETATLNLNQLTLFIKEIKDKKVVDQTQVFQKNDEGLILQIDMKSVNNTVDYHRTIQFIKE